MPTGMPRDPVQTVPMRTAAQGKAKPYDGRNGDPECPLLPCQLGLLISTQLHERKNEFLSYLCYHSFGYLLKSSLVYILINQISFDVFKTENRRKDHLGIPFCN